MGWVLITLYMGPVALALYVLSDKEPGTHEEFIRPLWKQGVGSTVHCVAGDVTGIITAAVITAALGLPMWIDLIVSVLLLTMALVTASCGGSGGASRMMAACRAWTTATKPLPAGWLG